MPNLNGMGPRGGGPMTGRGMGNCPGARTGFFGRRRGAQNGLGFRRFFSGRNQMPTLEEQEKFLEEELEAIRKEKAETQEK
ncbi:MAG TPA: DUF5320 family protein [Candidatus Paceibacterota bacterium]|jgi:hypothetical protein|nr:DUF5320 family protein [Candidatus Paceibacterota bacterium]